MGLMEKIFGDLNAKEVKKIEKIVDRIEAYDEAMQALSDDELRAKTDEFRARLAEGETLDDILPEAFAVCREGAWRSLGMKHFRVQLIGGVVLHQGRIAEMKTGEGKTLVATLAAYLNALEGKGVHVVTVNDYLAKRDAEWMGKLYSFLGLKVGCVIHAVEGKARHEQYMADITYGTNNEFGFDYLRDNMVTYKEELTQRELNFAIVDEVDSILIDEARTPLIISGRGVDSSSMYRNANTFVKSLVEGRDYKIEEKDNQIALTDEGVADCEKYFGIDNFSDPDNMELNHYVQQALRANYLMKRDVDYIVKDGEILIVDEFTGRLMYGRRFSNGLHQAIEAKEGVKVRSESKTLATITLQNYFRMYQKLSGMTGTAKTEEDEFRDIYNMDVVVIPTNKPVIRNDLQDSVYAHQSGKYKAIVEKVVSAHQTGQPVLVGTISIEISELISGMLKKRGVKHNVLNAKHHEQEAEIVAEAGRLGAVTIATNMAGRGTDIILGGNPDFEARKQMRKEEYTPDQILFATGFEKSDDPEMLAARDRYNTLLEEIKAERAGEQEKVKELGGLCIVGTERHESRRIDNQLRGRSGRQGDPGVTQFFISLEDDLMRLFGGERMQSVMQRVGMGDDEPLEAGMLSRSIESAQKKVEGKNFSIRKYVLQYDNVMNKQREIIYDQRRMVLNGEDVSGYIQNMTYELIDGIIDPVVLESKYPEEWDLKRITDGLEQITPNFRGRLTIDDDYINSLDENKLRDDIKAIFDEMYAEKEAEIGSEQMREVERMILLRVVDNRWMDHIDAMDQLKDGIGLRGIGQQDPAVAYAKEGFAMFDEMIADIREETVRFCYNVTVTTRTERKNVVTGRTSAAKEDYKDDTTGGMPGAAPKADKTGKQETIRRDLPKVGRNDPCPCGSGKKYKNCCGRNA
ncbi:MAG: preprotein translocase subunit SecA [Mogibacterium sp.]|nr:preprotein translocase subunit SecA [Mogibacterium sp.]MBR2539673.1 preprotein translocase subunit SecA [Mogibacterium sp.]